LATRDGATYGQGAPADKDTDKDARSIWSSGGGKLKNAVACREKGIDPDNWIDLSMHGDTVLVFQHIEVAAYESKLLADGFAVVDTRRMVHVEERTRRLIA